MPEKNIPQIKCCECRQVRENIYTANCDNCGGRNLLSDYDETIDARDGIIAGLQEQIASLKEQLTATTGLKE